MRTAMPVKRRMICSRCRVEATEENCVVREIGDGDEQTICGFCESELFDFVCEDHDLPDVSH